MTCHPTTSPRPRGRRCPRFRRQEGRPPHRPPRRPPQCRSRPRPTAVPPSSGPSAGRVIAILTAALGGLVAVVTIGGAAVATVGSGSTETVTRALDVEGIDELGVEATAGTLDISFADVDEAVLNVTSGPGRGDWTFERQGEHARGRVA